MGGDIPGAISVTRNTTVDDAVEFYKAFGMTQVRMLSSDSLDVNDPAALETIRLQKLTLYDIMCHSAGNDMIAREWTNGFKKVRLGADLLKKNGCGRKAIVLTFLDLLSDEPDTFIVKKHGQEIAEKTMKHAREVRNGTRDLVIFDKACIDAGINPGSTADLIIGSLYVALGEGWQWDS
jgi:triphosphoribosyl-dephospho-CoA synthase